MPSDKKRPVNLNLISFRFPPMALVSISHRISGFFLFLALPWVFYMFSQSVSSAAQFASLLSCLMSPWAKVVNWLVLIAALHHVVAGVRHLLMDIGWGESLKAARASAYVVLLVLVLIVLLTGVWIW